MRRLLRRLRERPIAESERRGALVLAALALCAATVLLAIARPVSPRARSPKTDTASAAHRTSPPRTPSGQSLSAQEERVGHLFLQGYLAYVYGRAPVGEVNGATPTLDRSLRAHPPIVSPAVRGLDSRLVSLHVVGSPPGALALRALVNDGGLVDYPLELRLEDSARRLLVSEVG